MKSLPIFLFSIFYFLFSIAPLAFAEEVRHDTQFSPELFKKRASPATLNSPKQGAEFFQPVFVANPGQVQKPKQGEPNFFEKIFNFFQNLITGEEGFVNFIRPASNPSWGKDPGGISLSTQDLQKSLYPAGRAPGMQYVAAGNIPSDLMEIFRKASTAKCVPMPMLLAIGEIEGGSMFNFTPEEIKRFSTPDWWVGASDEELKRGRCTNSCEPDPVNKCPAVKPPAIADVRGVMQFLIGTWQGEPEAKGEGGYVPQIRETLKQECTASGESENACQVWGSYKPQRCNLRDVIIGAAIKMRANSGTSENQCASWPENVVRNVASYYYGGKPSPDSCITTGGWNYCDKAWENYQKYSAQP